MLSFWEKKNFIRYDYIIIGAGITGLSTACCIKEKNPKASVLILERGLLPTGASTKNAGFACIGSLSEKLADLESMGEEKFLHLIEDRVKGLGMLRKRLGDENMDYQKNGGFELILNRAPIEDGKMEYMNSILKQIFNENVFHCIPQLVDVFGFNKEMVSNVVVNPIEAQIDTGKMMQTLWNYASILQIKIITGADVLSLNEYDQFVEINVRSIQNESISFIADKVAVCTNAFTTKFFPELEVNPGRGQVLCTSPIPDLKIKGTYSFEEGYYYFRNFEDRIIFGGGRNLDFEGEATIAFSINHTIQQQLEFYLEEMILPGVKYSIDQRWSGIMAFGKNKLPIIKKVSDRIAIGARLNGMGIALGSKVADDLSNLLLE
jgi:glycine/D-amino acid oxidase-like deaminating enzyme